MVQWLRICLPMQGTQVQSLVGELRSHMVPLRPDAAISISQYFNLISNSNLLPFSWLREPKSWTRSHKSSFNSLVWPVQFSQSVQLLNRVLLFATP